RPGWLPIKGKQVEIEDRHFWKAPFYFAMITAQDQARAVLGPILAKLGEAMQSGNLDEVIKFYSPDATLVLKGLKCAYGKDQVKEALAPHTAPADVKITNATFEATTDHIIYKAHVHSTIKANGAVFQGTAEQIWRKENGQYKCLHDEFTPIQ
ncbi:hypothetical protein PMAYCL1PPCAC_15955, partial [Pristionchus mayeri]